MFAGAPDRWYDEPATLVAAAAQAQRLLRSDVYSVNVTGPFSRHLAAARDAAEVCAALKLAEPRRVLAETLDAALHQLGERAVIVLDCPSPRGLLGPSAEAGFDELDDVAAGLLEVIRAVADRPIGGLQVTCDTVSGPDADEVDVWSSLLAAAGHYGWITAVRLDGVTSPDQVDTATPGDLLLLSRVAADALPDDPRYGGGLPPALWADTAEAARLAEAAAKRRFRFGEIPADAPPETVVARIVALGEAAW
ncbi:hypothetical protein [Pseudofrankia sp. DC12]|uniref:hypothetical protein n=1 Tax=Pseudofrankia sp. DC12 TaxID=683315 RepID=UPI0012FBFD78|nr:hypothetical protein [Pseudofrankia sp. DC12]